MRLQSDCSDFIRDSFTRDLQQLAFPPASVKRQLSLLLFNAGEGTILLKSCKGIV